MKLYLMIFIPFICFADKNHNAISIESDQLTIEQLKQVATFSGNVKAHKEEMDLSSDQLIVEYKDKSKKNNIIEKITAKGNVVAKTKDQIAKGNKAIYFVNKEWLEIYDNVTLIKGNNVMYGTKFTYDLKTGKSNLIGAKEDNDHGRVKLLITPEQ